MAMHRNNALAAGVAAMVLAVGGLCAAGQVSIVPLTPVSSQNFNLTAAGPVDWIKWNDTGFDHNATGGSRISDVSQLGVGTLSFDDAAVDENGVSFSWSNGAPTATATNALGDVWTDPGNANSVGTGVSFNVAVAAPSGNLRLWVTNYLAAAKLSASLHGTVTGVIVGTTDTGFVNNDTVNTPVDTGYYDIQYTGASPGDTLAVQFTVAGDNGNDTLGHGDVGVTAAALSPIPEPSTLGLLGFAGGLLIRRRNLIRPS